MFELRLPGDALITLVTRNDGIFVPTPDTVLRAGDQILLVTSDQGRAATERRLRAVSRAGRLAGWHGEAGEAGEVGEPSRREGREPPRPAAVARDPARDLTRPRRVVPAATARVEPRQPVTMSAAEPPR